MSVGAIGEQAALLQREWDTSPRWAGITRDYSAQDVIGLRGRTAGEHSRARRGASRLWDLLHAQDGAPALGAAAAGHAAQAAGTGPHAICLPGWQAADGVVPGQRPAPVVAAADAGLGGGPDAFELMTAMIGAGAAGVRFEDQLPPGRASGRSGDRALVPTGQHIGTLTAARLAADVLGVPTLVFARSGAHAAALLTSDTDERDHEFLTGERTAEGLHRTEPGGYACVTRALAYAPYADLLWLETPGPDLAAARAFACIIHSQYPGKLLAYSCPPPLTRQARHTTALAAEFQQELAAMGYRFQSATPAEHPAPGGTPSEPAVRHPRNDDTLAYA